MSGQEQYIPKSIQFEGISSQYGGLQLLRYCDNQSSSSGWFAETMSQMKVTSY